MTKGMLSQDEMGGKALFPAPGRWAGDGFITGPVEESLEGQPSNPSQG